MNPKGRNRFLKHDQTYNKHYFTEGGGVGDTMEIRKKMTNRNGENISRPLNGITGHASYN